jgi:glycosyltransferase involved in cell wall biosynthesis
MEWTGEADTQRKKDLLARASCLLFPIQWEEPFGIVMVEAMACGTPVVALRRGSAPEVVLDGITGFVCDRHSQLSESLDKIHSIDPRDCRNHAATHFDSSTMVAAYESVYSGLLNDRLRQPGIAVSHTLDVATLTPKTSMIRGA